MRKKYKNVTISLPEEIALMARVEAAKSGLSTSSFIAEILSSNLQRNIDYAEAQKKFLAKRAYLKGKGRQYPSREELYDD